MTKEKIIINAESLFSKYYKSLEEDKQKQSMNVQYVNSINPKSEITKSCNYYYDIAVANFNMISKLKNLPTYARIQTMSDLEIEAYRNEQISKLEKAIEEIENKPQQKKSSEQINDLKRQKSIIESKTPQDIRKELLDQVENNAFLSSIIKSTIGELNPTTELYGIFANNYVNANNIAALLTQYRLLCDQQQQIRKPLNIQNVFPELLKKELQKNSHYYDLESGEVINPDGLLNIISTFKKKYQQAKEIFTNQFTIDKLKGLINKKDEIDTLVVDLQFLKLHADKLEDDDLVQLQHLFSQINEHSGKFFKFAKTQKKIIDLNNQIRCLGHKMYNNIISWYETQGIEILDSPYGISFCSLDDLARTLEEAQLTLKRIEESIKYIENEVINCKNYMERQLDHYISKKVGIAQKIRSLADYRGKFSDTPISYSNDSYALSDSTEENMKKIKDSATTIKQREIVINVLTQAQLDADIKEAQLKGITIEQLLDEKKQAQVFSG